MVYNDIDNMDTPALRDAYKVLSREWQTSGMVMKFNDAVKAEMVIRGMAETPRNWVIAGMDVIADLKAAEYEDFLYDNPECRSEFD